MDKMVLIQRYQRSGDAEAFALLLEEFLPSVYGYARRIAERLSPRAKLYEDEALDTALDTLLSAIRCYVVGHGRFQPYLFQRVKWNVVARLRRELGIRGNRRGGREVVTTSELMRALSTSTGTPMTVGDIAEQDKHKQDPSEQAEDVERVRRIMNCLTNREREIFEAVYLNDERRVDVGRRLGITKQAIDCHLSNAVRVIRSILCVR